MQAEEAGSFHRLYKFYSSIFREISRGSTGDDDLSYARSLGVVGRPAPTTHTLAAVIQHHTALPPSTAGKSKQDTRRGCP